MIFHVLFMNTRQFNLKKWFWETAHFFHFNVSLYLMHEFVSNLGVLEINSSEESQTTGVSHEWRMLLLKCTLLISCVYHSKDKRKPQNQLNANFMNSYLECSEFLLKLLSVDLRALKKTIFLNWQIVEQRSPHTIVPCKLWVLARVAAIWSGLPSTCCRCGSPDYYKFIYKAE